MSLSRSKCRNDFMTFIVAYLRALCIQFQTHQKNLFNTYIAGEYLEVLGLKTQKNDSKYYILTKVGD